MVQSGVQSVANNACLHVPLLQKCFLEVRAFERKSCVTAVLQKRQR